MNRALINFCFVRGSANLSEGRSNEQHHAESQTAALMSSISCKECYSTMSQSERGGFVDDSMRYLSLHDDNSSLSSFEENREYLIESPRYNYLDEIKDAPWNLAIIRQTIRKVGFSDIFEILWAGNVFWKRNLPIFNDSFYLPFEETGCNYLRQIDMAPWNVAMVQQTIRKVSIFRTVDILQAPFSGIEIDCIIQFQFQNNKDRFRKTIAAVAFIDT